MDEKYINKEIQKLKSRLNGLIAVNSVIATWIVLLSSGLFERIS